VLETAALDFRFKTAADIAATVGAGRASALSVAEATFARIRACDPLLNSFTAVTEQRALSRARALDDARARGERALPLAGVPFAAKNLFDIAGMPTLAGSKNQPRRAAREPRRHADRAPRSGRRHACRRAQHG
jgi:aspartyl-tRNA(Asn)/glutamyl-tRNA(Gln) amidotransferase subunit A